MYSGTAMRLAHFKVGAISSWVLLAVQVTNVCGIDKPNLLLNEKVQGQNIGFCISMIFNFAKRRQRFKKEKKKKKK